MLFAAGALGGFLSGLLGIGGAPIYVVIFTYFINKLTNFSVPSSDYVKIVLAHTSFATMFAGLSGSYTQFKTNNFYWYSALAIAIPSSITSVAMAEILSHLSYSKNSFSIIFIICLLPILYRMIVQNPNKKQFNQPQKIKRLILCLTGILAGMVSALTGLGGGFIVVPVLNNFFNIKIRKTTSISLNVVGITSLCLAVYYMLRFNFSNINLPLMVGAVSFWLLVPVLVGVSIFAPLGVVFSKKLSPLQIRIVFSVVCLLVIAKTIYEMQVIS